MTTVVLGPLRLNAVQTAKQALSVNELSGGRLTLGEPRLAALAYFALGDDAEADAQRYLTDYYDFLGDETAKMIAGSAATDPDTVEAYLAAFEEAGCGELILFPCSNDPAQVDLLGAAVK